VRTFSSLKLPRIPKVLGLESVKDAEGNVIQEPPLPIWANFRQRALDTAILEITKNAITASLASGAAVMNSSTANMSCKW
jgi:hypothetical protein